MADVVSASPPVRCSGGYRFRPRNGATAASRRPWLPGTTAGNPSILRTDRPAGRSVAHLKRAC